MGGINNLRKEDYKWTSPGDSYARYLLICTWSSNCNNKQLWNQPHLCPWRDRATHQWQCARVQALLVLQGESTKLSTTSPSFTPPGAHVQRTEFLWRWWLWILQWWRDKGNLNAPHLDDKLLGYRTAAGHVQERNGLWNRMAWQVQRWECCVGDNFPFVCTQESTWRGPVCKVHRKWAA